MAMVIPMLVEIPVIRVIVEAHAGRGDAGLGVPAIAFAVAGDIGLGRRRHGGKGARGNRRAEGGLNNKFPDVHSFAPHGVKHPLRG